MSATKQQALDAGREIGNIVVMLLDETDNSQQIVQILNEGMGIGKFGYQLYAGQNPTEIAGVSTHVIQGILEVLNTQLGALKLPEA